MAEQWPFDISPDAIMWRKAMASRTGGRSITGSQQAVVSPSGFWRAELRAPVHGEDKTLAWRGFYASLAGMAGEVLVPMVDRWRPRDVQGRMIGHAGAVGFGVGGWPQQGHVGALHAFSGFAQEEPEIMFAEGAYGFGRTRMQIAHPGVPALRPGHYFGFGERLYLVSRVVVDDFRRTDAIGGDVTYGGMPIEYGGEEISYGGATTVVSGADLATVDFWPSLREPVAHGTPLILGRPVCRMALASDDTAVLEQDLGILGRPVAEFEEVL